MAAKDLTWSYATTLKAVHKRSQYVSTAQGDGVKPVEWAARNYSAGGINKERTTAPVSVLPVRVFAMRSSLVFFCLCEFRTPANFLPLRRIYECPAYAATAPIIANIMLAATLATSTARTTARCFVCKGIRYGTNF